MLDNCMDIYDSAVLDCDGDVDQVNDYLDRTVSNKKIHGC